MTEAARDKESLIRGLTEELLAALGVAATIKIVDEEGDLWVDIASPDSALLIGWRGSHLAALEYLVRVIVFAHSDPTDEDRHEIYVDIEGYKRRQIAELEALARRIATAVQASRQSEVLQPMTAFERRIIHASITDIEEVDTESIGEGHSRRVMVKYVGNK